MLAKSLQYSVNTSPVPPDLTKGILKEIALVLPEPASGRGKDPGRGLQLSQIKGRSLNVSAARLTVEALQAAYPCKSG